MPPVVIAEARQHWAPPNHDIFKLVPEDFEAYASHLYAQMGSPIVTLETFWDVYRQLFDLFHALPHAIHVLETVQDRHDDLIISQTIDAPVELLPGQADWRGEDQGAFMAGHGGNNVLDDVAEGEEGEEDDHLFVLFPGEDDVDEPY